MNQTRPFDPSIAGTIHNFCLDNVRRGFGIENKYASAWEAWEHTEQHPDRDIPDGLDVPLFYSYTANIDGVTQNYGHINVRLANGTVWSDGTIYANIDAYLYNHYPQYVGWGESVNDFKIIEGEDMSDIADFNFVNDAALGTLGHEVNGDQNLLNNVGRPKSDVLREFDNYPEAVEFRRKASAYDGLVSHVTELEAQIAAQGQAPAPAPSPAPGDVITPEPQPEPAPSDNPLPPSPPKSIPGAPKQKLRGWLPNFINLIIKIFYGKA